MDLATQADDVRAAAERIRPLARKTPVFTSASFDAEAGMRVYFKCENLQRGGAFKIRGVVAYSSGNHAQATAIAARHVGGPATIVMPADAPRSKMEATRAGGATRAGPRRPWAARRGRGRAISRAGRSSGCRRAGTTAPRPASPPR